MQSFLFSPVSLIAFHFPVLFSLLNSVVIYNYIFVVNADQVASESSIPLSPQWLYAKPVDAKSFTTGTSGVRYSLTYAN